MTKHRRLVLGAAVLALASCKVSPEMVDGSDLSIDSGIYITPEAKNTIPAVVWIGNCSATAVSDNTLVTAAHCVERQQGADGRVSGQVCVRSGAANGVCSETLWAPTEYFSPAQAAQKYKWDVAVAVFPRGTFKNYFPVRTQRPAVGDNILLVGYSSDNQTEQGLGSKRWGRNRISRFLSNITIVSDYGTSPDRVAVSPGDSGGPLFIGCQLTGVASRMQTGGAKSSLHTNLTIDENVTWLRSLDQKGGYVCGLHGNDQARCAASGMASPVESPAAEGSRPGFPCAASSAPGQGQQGGGSTPPRNFGSSGSGSGSGAGSSGGRTPPATELQAKVAVAEEGTNNGRFYVALTGEGQLEGCLSDRAGSCTGREFGFTLQASRGGRVIYKAQALQSLSESAANYLMVRGPDGKSLVVEIRRK